AGFAIDVLTLASLDSNACSPSPIFAEIDRTFTVTSFLTHSFASLFWHEKPAYHRYKSSSSAGYMLLFCYKACSRRCNHRCNDVGDTRTARPKRTTGRPSVAISA